MRVLMISPEFRPIVGGYERAAERLSTALVEAGIRVVVIAERRDRAWPAIEAINGYEIRRLPCSYRRHLHTITSLLSFAGFLLRHGRTLMSGMCINMVFRRRWLWRWARCCAGRWR